MALVDTVLALIAHLPIWEFLVLVGFLTVGYFALWFTYFAWMLVYAFFVGKAFGHSTDLRKLGKWAVVTGATDGIGKAYAEELANLGVNIVLISRTQSKLDYVAKAIEDSTKVETKVIAVDFTGSDIYDKIREELKDLEIGILVNNVGMSYEYPEYFLDVPGGETTDHKLINCNIISCITMTRIIMPQMVSRGKGVILNLSSTAAIFPMPFLNIYSSCKVFVDYFTRALQMEYKEKGIFIQSVIPFFVATNMSKIRQTSLTVPSPSEYVRFQLNSIGLESRTFGYPVHKIQGLGLDLMIRLLPDFVPGRIFHRALKGMNQRAHKHLERLNNKKKE